MTDPSPPAEQTHVIPRHLLAKYFAKDPRLISAFENQALAVMGNSQGLADAQSTLAGASVISLSPNDALENESVLGDGDGTKIEGEAGAVKISVDDTVARAVNFKVTFQPPAEVMLQLPSKGKLLSDAEPSTAYGKTLDKPKLQGLVDAPDDATAAGAGVPVGGVYHSAGALRVRLA